MWTLIVQLGSCPRPDRAVSLAAKGEPQAFTQFGRDLRAAADRAEARIASLDALEPLASQLRNFPRNVAPAANPANPAAAEKAIADALNSILEQIAAALERPAASPA